MAAATYYFIGSGKLQIGGLTYSYGQAIDTAKLGGAAELKKLVQDGLVSGIPTKDIERSRTLAAPVVVTQDARPKWPGGWTYSAATIAGMTLAQKNGLVADGVILLDQTIATAGLDVVYPFSVGAEIDAFLTAGTIPEPP